MFLPLPERDDEGRKVILIRATIHNPLEVEQNNVFKVIHQYVSICIMIND